MSAAPKFAADPRRRALLAKVHLAKKQLGLADDDYRAVLFDVVGRASAADCSEPELVRIVERFRQRGFADRPTKPRGAARADHPVARKARAMWISLHLLGAVEDPRETALEAFARRQLGVERMQWANQAQGYKLIEALKAMAERAGWSHDLAGIPKAGRVTVLKRRLCERVLLRAKSVNLAARHWTLAEASWHLLGERREADELKWAATEYDVIAAGLAAKLRAFLGR